MGLPVVPEVYISVHGSVGRHLLLRLAVARRCDQVLVGRGSLPGRRLGRTGCSVLAATGRSAADLLGDVQKLVLDDQRCGLGVLDDVADLGAR